MTSERQRAANQANARHSTGPKTPEGKAAVRLNAFRHGLLARDVVLPEEDFGRLRGSPEPGSGRALAGGADRGASRGSRGQHYVEARALGTGRRPRSLIGGSGNSR